MMTIFVKINISTSSIYVHEEDLQGCVDRESVDEVSTVYHSDMTKRSSWESYNHTFSVFEYTRTEKALADFLKYAEGIMGDNDWVIVECNKDNIAHRIRYHPEVDVYNRWLLLP